MSIAPSFHSKIPACKQETFRIKIENYPRDFAKKLKPLDFEYCVILIYRLEVSDRAGDVQVTFVFQISCVGISVISLLKKC